MRQWHLSNYRTAELLINSGLRDYLLEIKRLIFFLVFELWLHFNDLVIVIVKIRITHIIGLSIGGGILKIFAFSLKSRVYSYQRLVIYQAIDGRMDVFNIGNKSKSQNIYFVFNTSLQLFYDSKNTKIKRIIK